MAVEETQQSTRQPAYEAGSQFRHWRFSKNQLQESRSSLNKAAVAAIKATFETESPGSSSSISFLTPGEEVLLVKLYASKVSQLCGHFRFPEEVEATAVSYLKRFYLKNTVMDWHPKNVMLTSLFLATKTTNHPISLETYASNVPKTAPSDVLDLEFLVAQSLGFEFSVWPAHRALWGLYLDIQNLSGVSLDQLKDAYESAQGHTRASRLTDAEFIYTPSQIALACLSLTSSELASQWARSKNLESILPSLESITGMIRKDGVGPDVEAVREVDKRLRLCKNPRKLAGSKAYAAKKAEEEATAEEKRIRKAERQARAMEADDPFADGPSTKDVDMVPSPDDDDDDD